MRVRARAIIFLVVWIGCALVVPRYFEGSTRTFLALGLWLLGGVVQFFILRCPHCHRLAFGSPSGLDFTGIGTACRHCKHSY
ncbi:MAG: hypothetical protein NTW91_06515 [Verrucomicrobia bacterium]|nr:hypothetical protein [Verrucomicrobiota bacterium]